MFILYIPYGSFFYAAAHHSLNLVAIWAPRHRGANITLFTLYSFFFPMRWPFILFHLTCRLTTFTISFIFLFYIASRFAYLANELAKTYLEKSETKYLSREKKYTLSMECCCLPSPLYAGEFHCVRMRFVYRIFFRIWLAFAFFDMSFIADSVCTLQNVPFLSFAVKLLCCFCLHSSHCECGKWICKIVKHKHIHNFIKWPFQLHFHKVIWLCSPPPPPLLRSSHFFLSEYCHPLNLVFRLFFYSNGYSLCCWYNVWSSHKSSN